MKYSVVIHVENKNLCKIHQISTKYFRIFSVVDPRSRSKTWIYKTAFRATISHCDTFLKQHIYTIFYKLPYPTACITTCNIHMHVILEILRNL